MTFATNLHIGHSELCIIAVRGSSDSDYVKARWNRTKINKYYFVDNVVISCIVFFPHAPTFIEYSDVHGLKQI